MRKIIIPVMLLPLMWACGQEGKQGSSEPSSSANIAVTGQEAVDDHESAANILQIAVGSKDHTTLVAAVKAAEQTTALANNGPLTVFAPVNSAFDALPEGTVENLLKPENKMALTNIVQFHAAPGNYDIHQLKDGQRLFMASGHNILVKVKEDGTYVNGAKIIGTVKAANGFIHVVDKVLLPES